ncbi:hypothetical protein GCM10027089_14290 [Nocardia thraciensis]
MPEGYARVGRSDPGSDRRGCRASAGRRLGSRRGEATGEGAGASRTTRGFGKNRPLVAADGRITVADRHSEVLVRQDEELPNREQLYR